MLATHVYKNLYCLGHIVRRQAAAIALNQNIDIGLALIAHMYVLKLNWIFI